MTSRLSPDPEHEELRAAVSAFLDRRCGPDQVRAQLDTEQGYDKDVWRQCAGQLGLVGLEIGEQYGGSGASFRELAVVLELMGRTLACLPYFSTVVLASGALLLGDDDGARQRYLPGLADGSTIATVAVAESTGTWDAVMTTAQRRDAGWVLSGEKSFVPDGLAADLLLVVAQAPGGLSMFAVDGAAPGLTRTAMRTLDPTRRQALLGLAQVPAELVGREGAAGPLLDRLHDRAAVALGCEQLGTAARALEMAVGYAGQRLQFGRVIGSFQAVKHRCADMASRVEEARSAAAWAVAAAAENSADLPVAAAMAGVVCSEAAVFATAENVQVHGGLGFTWEHPAHLYFRRARAASVQLRDPAQHREQLLVRLGA